MKKFLYRLERIVSKIAVENLMLVIIGAMAIVYLANMMYPDLYPLLMFSRALILKGQIWRIFTFIFLYSGSIIYFLLFGYFYWWIGSSLESHWGKTRFCTYYYVGIVALIAAGFITGYTTIDFLNMSLFFAFAMLDPNREVLLFFVIPVKIKWLAWADAFYFVLMFIFSSWPIRAAIIASFLNFLLFFYSDFFRRAKFLFMDIRYRIRSRRR